MKIYAYQQSLKSLGAKQTASGKA